MFKWLSYVFKRSHECEFMVLGVMEASVGKERTCYGVATCKKFLCGKMIYFPQEFRDIHEQWMREGKDVVESFERNFYMNY